MSVKHVDSADRIKTAGHPRSAAVMKVRRGLFQPATLAWLACGLLIIVFLPYLPWMIPDLSALPEYRVGWDRIQVTPPPAGTPSGVIGEIRAAARLPDEFSLLERGLAARLARAFAAHPWIQNVHRVEVRRQRLIAVDVSYRRVAVLLETGRGYYPVDANGVLLPPADFDPGDVAKLPILRNVKSLPQGGAGEPWGDVLVRCAAQLAAALTPGGDLDRHWNRLGLQALIAPTPRLADPAPEDLSYELMTRGGSIILWGRAPGADALEPSVEEKLGRLDQVVQTQGSLDGPGGPRRIDIRHDVISLQPLLDQRMR